MSAKREQLLDLYAECAASGLAPESRAELDQLEREVGGVQPEALEYEHAAAALACARAQLRRERMPDSLPARLEIAAQRFEQEQQRAAQQPADPPRTNALRTAPEVSEFQPSAPRLWLAAAALLTVVSAALGTLLVARNARIEELGRQLAERSAQPSAREKLDGLLAAAEPGLLRVALQPGPDATGQQVSGELVWSPERQEGYMRLIDLAPNDASREQYQLWIFDGGREQPQPVDGGVFDIERNGEVVVPIQAALQVVDALQFAITVEPPGGVVVSSQERISALAKP